MPFLTGLMPGTAEQIKYAIESKTQKDYINKIKKLLPQILILLLLIILGLSFLRRKL